MLPVILGSKFVTLEVSSSQIPDTQIREISFNLFNLDTGITLKDVTYFIMAEKSNELLFEGTFQRDDGILLMHFIPTESKQVLVEEQDSGFFNSLAGPNKIISAKSSVFGSGGLYYSIPFNWSKENIEQTSVMHQELIIPKTFGDLMVKSLSANINSLPVPDNVITIDDFSSEYRIVHLVLSQKELLLISEKLQNSNSKMEFAIMPTEENLPLSTVTGNGQFRINLSWDPQNIESGSKTIFMFDIMDIFLLDRPVSVSYDVSIIHDGEKLFQKSGFSTDSKTKPNTLVQ